MGAVQAIVLAIVQGITELFPISSLGHAVLLPAILHWNIDENDPGFLPFLVVMHLGTAAALIVYFWRDWLDFATAVLIRRGPKAASERRLFWQVVVATIPAVIVGFIFEKMFRRGFGSPELAAICLILNGLMLFVADRVKRGDAERPLERLGWGQALLIGVLQCLALVPGFSRSGATTAGGYLLGLSHEDAARFSFLTATPVILGAGILEAPKILHHQGGAHFSGVAVLAGVVAGVFAFLSAAVLMPWYRTRESRAFGPFAIYCAAAGLAALLWLKFG